MFNLIDDIETLKNWRENNERKSREIIEKWNNGLEDNIDKLGRDKYLILEQVCVAALDCFQVRIAEKCIQTLYASFPNSLRVKKYESMCYEVQEKYEDAIRILEEVIKKDETNSAARKRKVAIFKTLAKTTDAIKELTDYLKIFMVDVEAWQELSELYILEQDFNRAAFCIEELILHNPHNHLLHQRLADIRYTQGGTENYEQARAYYCQAVKLNPNNLRALYGLYLVSSLLSNSPKNNPQKKKENTKIATWAQSEIKKIYSVRNVTNLEERLSAIQL